MATQNPQPQLGKFLENGTVLLSSINGYLAGAAAAIVLGKSLVALFRSAGGKQYLTPEAQAEIDKLDQHLGEAGAFNQQWLASHPDLPPQA